MNDKPISSRQALIEVALIFAVFAVQGAWPVPDVNESHYLAKAVHYWNPGWLGGDFFVESADTHKVFYFTFGWLSLWLKPFALAWTGRIATWLLLAWAWQRLSAAVVPRRWFSILTAALFGCLMERCHMAGEWVIGGVEAKGFAYVCVFLGLEALVRNRWNRALALFGAGAAFHALVGGWAAVAAAVAWLWLQRRRTTGDVKPAPPLRSLWPGVVGGFLLALPGLIPSLTLDAGVDPQVVRQAHQIYVFERLPHHLVLTGMRPEFILRLTLLWGFWLLLGTGESITVALRKRTVPFSSNENWDSPPVIPSPVLGRWSGPVRQGDRRECPSSCSMSRLRAFVTATVMIALAGAAIHALIWIGRAWAADLLRFYWFRMTDVALPLGVALESVARIVGMLNSRKLTDSGTQVLTFRRLLASGRCWLALAIVVAAFHVMDRAVDRIVPSQPRSHRIADFEAWRAACDWVANSGQIRPDARFLSPRLAQTFKWYANRNDVAVWKDVPQNAEAIVEWWNRVQNIHATRLPPPEPRWHDPLAERGEESLRQLGAKYRADYLIVERTDPSLDLEKVYENRTYVIYRLQWPNSRALEHQSL